MALATKLWQNQPHYIIKRGTTNNSEKLETIKIDFGVNEAKALKSVGHKRAIGYRIHIFKVTRELYQEGEELPSYYGMTPFPETTIYEADTTVTYDGERYGASSSNIQGATLEQVKADALARAEAARKRYVKKASK